MTTSAPQSPPTLLGLTPEEIDAVFASDDPSHADLQARLFEAAQCGYYTFQPRPDCPEEFDEQSTFIRDTESKFSILLGGTGSGKTVAAAYKTAKYVLETPPPRSHCPFWIIGEYLEQICAVAWKEKLANIIPKSAILDYVWHMSKRQWPRAVILKHPDNPKLPGWILEFKSYEQGIGSMKAQSIGGYWFNEEVPYEIVHEVQGRCREYDSPGWADFTPVEAKSPEWIDCYENPPAGWRFFHLNTGLNYYNEPGWFDRWIASIPEDLREMRTIGKFAVLAGAVFKEFRKSVHVVDPFDIPLDWKKFRGIDFGFNNPFCCLWVAKDRDGRYYIYDEHYAPQRLNEFHAAAIHERDWDSSSPFFGPTYSDHDAQQRAELAKLGIHCTPARKDINHGIEIVRSHMLVQGDGKPKLFIFSNCVNLIREIQGYQWPSGSSVRNPADTPLDKDNHAVDSARYILASDQGFSGNTFGTSHKVQPDGRKHGVLLNRGGRR